MPDPVPQGQRESADCESRILRGTIGVIALRTGATESFGLTQLRPISGFVNRAFKTLGINEGFQ